MSDYACIYIDVQSDSVNPEWRLEERIAEFHRASTPYISSYFLVFYPEHGFTEKQIKSEKIFRLLSETRNLFNVLSKKEASVLRDEDCKNKILKHPFNHIFITGIYIDKCVQMAAEDFLKLGKTVSVISDLTNYTSYVNGHNMYARNAALRAKQEMVDAGIYFKSADEALRMLAAQPEPIA